MMVSFFVRSQKTKDQPTKSAPTPGKPRTVITVYFYQENRASNLRGYLAGKGKNAGHTQNSSGLGTLACHSTSGVTLKTAPLAKPTTTTVLTPLLSKPAAKPAATLPLDNGMKFLCSLPSNYSPPLFFFPLLSCLIIKLF